MGELEQRYGDRVHFRIVAPEETARRGAELEALHLAHRGHGLVAFTAQGDPAVILAGHQYGREEVEMAVRQVAEP